ncbi:hypothetical protein KGY77_10225 [Candidatus Bipolaricaulota bacterium]|nr:hypothetical protein [Candidatus Bipolaricaulota bacterium]
MHSSNIGPSSESVVPVPPAGRNGDHTTWGARVREGEKKPAPTGFDSHFLEVRVE